jgi:hypothetical protein
VTEKTRPGDLERKKRPMPRKNTNNMTYSILVENNKESKGEKAAQEPHQVAEINISIRLIKNVQMQGSNLSYE